MRYDDITPGAASALIWCRITDTVLFILRSELGNDPLQWAFPGGHVEPGESYDEALHRELQEEIGRDLINNPKVLLSVSHTTEPAFTHKCYAIAVNKQFKPKLNWEHVDFKWKALGEMPEPQTWSIGMLMSNDEAAERLKQFQERVKKAG